MDFIPGVISIFSLSKIYSFDAEFDFRIVLDQAIEARINCLICLAREIKLMEDGYFKSFGILCVFD